MAGRSRRPALLSLNDPGFSLDPLFPVVDWDEGRAAFVRSINAGSVNWEPWAVVVFAPTSEGFLISNITGRGWCTPSGRIESGETPLQAAHRELYEEAGARSDQMVQIGVYLFEDQGQVRCAPTFVASHLQIAAIPAESEAQEARIFPMDQLPPIYFRWNPLIAKVFRYALEFESPSREAT